MTKASTGRLTPSYPVAGVSNALQLLLLLEQRQCLKLTDVSSELGIGLSTAHRLLSIFRQAGFVDQEGSGRTYRVGPKLLGVSKILAERNVMLLRLRPLLESLVGRLNETVHVATLNGSMVMYIDCVESRKAERATSRAGRVMPAYATASGKALLSSFSREEIEALYPSECLAPLTSHTLATREALLQDLSTTSRRGFATNENESQLGFFACSSLIKVEAGAPSTAIVVAGPIRRFRKNRYRFAEQLCEVAEEAGRL